MSETTSKWDRLNAFLDRGLVPVNYVALASGLIVVAASIVGHNYNLWFWMAIGLILWSMVDIVKWRRRKRAARPVGPEDTPEWSRSKDV